MRHVECFLLGAASGHFLFVLFVTKYVNHKATTKPYRVRSEGPNIALQYGDNIFWMRPHTARPASPDFRDASTETT